MPGGSGWNQIAAEDAKRGTCTSGMDDVAGAGGSAVVGLGGDEHAAAPRATSSDRPTAGILGFIC
jgi:hypothetical protein